MVEARYAFVRCHMCAQPVTHLTLAARHPPMLRGSASDEGKAKVTALRFKLAVTQALNTLFGEVGAALPVDLLGFDEPKQEAIMRLPAKCAAPCMSMFMSHTLQPGNHGTQESSAALERADADHRLREEAVPSASARGGGHLVAAHRVARVAKGLCGPPAATWVAVHASRLHLATACHHLLLAPSSLALDSRVFLQKHATELQPRAARQAGADQLAHGTEGDSLHRDELRGREPRREPGGPSGSC